MGTYTSVINTGGVIPLALSNDKSIQLLGPRRWKNLHRLSYAIFAITILHGFMVQALEVTWLGIDRAAHHRSPVHYHFAHRRLRGCEASRPGVVSIGRHQVSLWWRGADFVRDSKFLLTGQTRA